ncbi:MarR family transcriptional regulator [Streptacidiphilus neutrinimicus]|uniref:MarR family transcriptional regulator n=1 Tax=Streptacidiphilus neutrinimicus TaxID=105420 RepID=UPI0005A9F316|nr:helix-turn-helix domain-containing protein [Streptacidiphilus neutrinimicus]
MTLTAVPDVPDGLTPSAARIQAALHASPGSTVAELARAAQTGKSTAANLLKQMEQDGLVRRTLGGSDGNRRFPDHWYATATLPAESEVSNAPDRGGEGADLSSTNDDAADNDETVAQTSAAPEDELPRDAQPDRRGDEQGPGGAIGAEPRVVPVAASGEAPPNGRLGQGGLRALVLGFLADHADTAHSPTKISRQLGRSSGAVANALVTLVNLRQAEMVTAKPRTYRLAASAAQLK